MSDMRTYNEKLSSSKTEALFVALTVIFLLLFIWRFMVSGIGALAIVFLCIFFFFLFYSLNYRTLVIRLTPEHSILKFGIFTWNVPLDNIKDYYLDDTLMWGGAGIHFMMLRGKYCAFFNFLEYPRVVITLKKKKGPVREVAFSTLHPEEIIGFIQGASTQE